MSRRLLLRRQLYSAWKETIQRHYQSQEINSERGLQVFFCSALLTTFEGAGLRRRLFVEPRLVSGSDGSGPQPDVLICNSRKVIAVVELKYLPRVAPKTYKDLETLGWVASHGGDIRITNDRYLGSNRVEKEYSLSSDAVLCWAGVHKGLDGALSERVAENVYPYFLELHAVTAINRDPKIISNYKPRNDL